MGRRWNDIHRVCTWFSPSFFWWNVVNYWFFFPTSSLLQMQLPGLYNQSMGNYAREVDSWTQGKCMSMYCVHCVPSCVATEWYWRIANLCATSFNVISITMNLSSTGLPCMVIVVLKITWLNTKCLEILLQHL